MKTKKLEELNPCSEGLKWVKTQKSIEDAWNNCERGDWMLWVAKKLNVDDRLLTLTKATCANEVRHLMKDQRSLDALDACFRYAKGEISREDLNEYTPDAAAVSVSASYDAAYYAASAAYAAAYASAPASSTESLKKSADICREIFKDVVIKKYKIKR